MQARRNAAYQAGATGDASAISDQMKRASSWKMRWKPKIAMSANSSENEHGSCWNGPGSYDKQEAIRAWPAGQCHLDERGSCA